MPRLFTALELPGEATDALSRLRQPLPGARWVSEENFHITLRFAGDISRRQSEELADALGEIVFDSFEVRLAGIDVFGGAAPRVLWARVAPSDELSTLAAAHERAARSIGLGPETRKFRPHVTLARLNGTPVHLVARYLQQKGKFVFPAFSVTRFVLLSAKSHVGGGPYVIEASYPCAGIPDFDDDDYKEYFSESEIRRP